MGLIYQGIPEKLAKFIHDSFKVDNFVETGTYYGNTALWASKYFKQVYTVERSAKLFEISSKRLRGSNNIKCVLGDSKTELNKIVNEIDGPALFWLDAHYSGGETAGGGEKAPIMDEIEAINSSKFENFILIDDARVFLALPPDPQPIDEYPFIWEIGDALTNLFYVIVYDDVIVCCPKKHTTYMQKFSKQEISKSFYKWVEEKEKKEQQKTRLLFKIKKKVESVFKKESKEEIRVKPWFRDNGDKTLRLNYDLNSNSVVFDVGGYKGNWAADIFCKYNCFIHIFEPVSAFALEIKTRFYNNDKITVNLFGLSDKEMKAKIFLDGSSSSAYKELGNFEEVCLKDIMKYVSDHEIEKIDLMKINIEGEEYNLLNRLIETGLVESINNLQIQFHDFFPDADKKMKKIQRDLSKTHHLTYQYEFVWENWEKNE
jgi:FkbM family methyltransferase